MDVIETKDIKTVHNGKDRIVARVEVVKASTGKVFVRLTQRNKGVDKKWSYHTLSFWEVVHVEELGQSLINASKIVKKSLV